METEARQEAETMTPPDPTKAALAEELHEPLAAWSFNVMLECSGRDEKDCEVMIGGAFLDLRDLKRILDWATELDSRGREG